MTSKSVIDTSNKSPSEEDLQTVQTTSPTNNNSLDSVLPEIILSNTTPSLIPTVVNSSNDMCTSIINMTSKSVIDTSNKSPSEEDSQSVQTTSPTNNNSLDSVLPEIILSNSTPSLIPTVVNSSNDMCTSIIKKVNPSNSRFSSVFPEINSSDTFLTSVTTDLDPSNETSTSEIVEIVLSNSTCTLSGVETNSRNTSTSNILEFNASDTFLVTPSVPKTNPSDNQQSSTLLEMPASCSLVTFCDLPDHVIEAVLQHLNFSKLASLRGLCRRLKVSCGRLFRIAVRRLVVNIDEQLSVLYEELVLATDPDTMLLRLPLLRYYNILEILRAELRMMCAICRHSLTKQDECFPAGQLLDMYYAILRKVKAREIPSWSLENDVTCRLLRLSKQFLDNYIHEYSSSIKFGVRIVDLMDILVDANISLTVTYDIRNELCHLTAEYEMDDTKFLCLPPINEEDISERRLTDEESRCILDYLISIVRFNNRLLLREEQYWREMEATRKIQQDLQHQGYAVSPPPRLGILSRHPRQYSSTRHCRERQILSHDGPLIRETYKGYAGTKFHFKGFKCRVVLTCPIGECPLDVINCWEKLSSQLNSGKNVEFKRADAEVNVRILGFLELPRRIGPLTDVGSTAYGVYDREEIVGIHFPSPHQQLLNEASTISLRGSDYILNEREVSTSLDSSSSSSSGTRIIDTYSLFVEFKVFIPVRGNDAEVFRLSFRDGEQEVQENDINYAMF